MKAWEDIAPEPLSFPVKGKVYTIPELDYRTMLTIQKIRAGQATELDGADAAESWRLVMGAAFDEMVADGVSAEALSRAGLATLAFFEHGREMAELIWEQGIDPKAVLEALAANAPRTTSSSTAAANETPSPAPSSGTSSPKAASKKRTAKGSRSPR